jgi:hypothetical protein
MRTLNQKVVAVQGSPYPPTQLIFIHPYPGLSFINVENSMEIRWIVWSVDDYRIVIFPNFQAHHLDG